MTSFAFFSLPRWPPGGWLYKYPIDRPSKRRPGGGKSCLLWRSVRSRYLALDCLAACFVGASSALPRAVGHRGSSGLAGECIGAYLRHCLFQSWLHYRRPSAPFVCSARRSAAYNLLATRATAAGRAPCSARQDIFSSATPEMPQPSLWRSSLRQLG